jgi:hypothetical protein
LLGRLGVPIQAAQRIGAGGEQEVVDGECSGGFQRLHQRQPGGRPVGHRDRRRPVQLNHRGGPSRHERSVRCAGSAAALRVRRGVHGTGSRAVRRRAEERMLHELAQTGGDGVGAEPEAAEELIEGFEAAQQPERRDGLLD